jgi:S-adenosylmethionine synthetase
LASPGLFRFLTPLQFFLVARRKLVDWHGAESVSYLMTSESVTEGHPDKVCDLIADSILDACLERDPLSRVACEVLCKDDLVVLAGEITCEASLDYTDIARETVRAVGYGDRSEPFHADGLRFVTEITRQSPEICRSVDLGHDGDQGAGDQGVMFGYATDETPELMPLPILLAHRLAGGLAEDRRCGLLGWLRPDGKTQVTVEYEDGRPAQVSTVLVSTQHAPGVPPVQICDYVTETLAPRVLGSWWSPSTRFIVNPSGSFERGGPSSDCGVTGRKIIVDTYGGAARHGGGAFSGKDASKVDRSGAYFCRYVARQIVRAGLARRAELQVAYAIGQAEPVSVMVETFGTGDAEAAEGLVRRYDFRLSAIIERLNLREPIFRQTTNYGHFGKPGLPWEATH